MDNLMHFLVYTKLQRYLPVETGNLAYNAFNGRKNAMGASYWIDLGIAGYFELLDKGQTRNTKHQGIFDNMVGITVDEINSYSKGKLPSLQRKLRKRQQAIEATDSMTDHQRRETRKNYWIAKARGEIY